MRVVGDLLAGDRQPDQIVIRQPGRTPATVGYDRLCTNAWKTAHLFRHCGARDGSVVGIIDAHEHATVLAVFASAMLGAAIRMLDTDRDLGPGIPALDVLVGPTDRLPTREEAPTVSMVGYGDSPTDPAVAHLERDAWSENPTPPPETVDPDTVLIQSPAETRTHAEGLSAARTVCERLGLEPADVVAVRAPLWHPGTVVSGILAPLLAGGTVCFPDSSTVADAAIATDDAPEARVLDPSTVD